MAVPKIEDKYVKVVFVENDKLVTDIATVYTNGSILVSRPDSEFDLVRHAGEWWSYLTYGKASQSLYNSAIKLARKRASQD